MTLLYAASADADRIWTFDAVLTLESSRGNLLAKTLKVMLDAAVKDLRRLTDQAVKRAVTHPVPTTSTPRSATLAAGRQAPATAKSGCYIATAVYGSYDCPQVWVLRRFRDRSLGTSRAGRLVIAAYYGLSPRLVRLVGRKKWFLAPVRRALDVFVSGLHNAGYESTPYVDGH